MSKQAAILAIHGMGRTEPNFADELFERLRDRLNPQVGAQLHFGSIYYQDILQSNQDRVMRASREVDLDWIRLRKFLLYGFGDAGGLEHRASEADSPYHQAQARILQAINAARGELADPERPVVILAHSLGCQVLSNYIWDAQAASAGLGVWKGQTADGSADDNFRRLRTLRLLFSTGCNIPIFLAGFDEDDIHPITTQGQGYNIRWENFYDQDDVLGWPLRVLNGAYATAVVADRATDVGGFLTKWNPLSHNEYWTDRDFLRAVTPQIESLVA